MGAMTLVARSEERVRLRDVTEGRFVLQRFLATSPRTSYAVQCEWMVPNVDGTLSRRTNTHQIFVQRGDDRDAVIGALLDDLERALVYGERGEWDGGPGEPVRTLAGAKQLLGRMPRLDDTLELSILRGLTLLADVPRPEPMERASEANQVWPFVALLEVSLVAYPKEPAS